jgi:hypothetical protein
VTNSRRSRSALVIDRIINERAMLTTDLTEHLSAAFAALD